MAEENSCSDNGPSGFPQKYLTKQQTAALLGITCRTLEHWMRRRLIPYYRIGRTIRFKAEVVQQYLDAACKVDAMQQAA